MNNYSLIEKYNVPVPRYTSYPTVPNWTINQPRSEEWISSINEQLIKDKEISLYIHLPFCEELCTYCACNKRITKNHSVESPYIDSLLKEWKYYIQHLSVRPIIKELHFGGGTPTFFSSNELRRLVNGIEKLSKFSDQKLFSLEVHPNTTTYDQLRTLRELGFNRLSIGVQDVNEFILSAINRTQTKEQIEFLTSASNELGYESINYDIIYGLPFQRIEDIEETMSFINNQRPDRLAFYSYAHVPWKSKGQRAFSDEDVPDGQEKILLRLKGEEILKKIGYHHIGMDHYALESDTLYKSYISGKLHRNFMGFTESSTKILIGLGASSISESHSMYVQNEKNVEAYQENINSGILPFIKGHRLNKAELLIRDNIISLMCQNSTSWDKNEAAEYIMEKALHRMSSKVQEGLVIVDKNVLQITPKGRAFVRNICADIDIHFSHQSEKLFSKAL
ncbi:MAG: oxygen-independent coproporphyrinogen III oxidase [Saprospiraceae bacterium]|nr:oxygen-independent coproporphyrinogen III oxidase [Saprospiraceae bacterium]|tara:strand:+ start:691 stop:2040 length:1350 start_codon:yes stop_codon:yes gene_type:complete